MDRSKDSRSGLRIPAGFAPVLLPLMLSGCHPGARVEGPESEPVLRIYLARHGQTDWNAARRLQGWTDIELNETGRAQARDLAARLDGVPIDTVFCSGLKRSRETAEIVSRGRFPIESLPALNEQRLGKFEGAYIDGRDPGILAEYQRRSADPDDSLDTGESLTVHHARVRAAVNEILRRHRKGTLLIVGHGGTNSAILAALFGLDPKQASEIKQSNDELYLIELAPAHPPRLWKRIPPDHLGEL